MAQNQTVVKCGDRLSSVLFLGNREQLACSHLQAADVANPDTCDLLIWLAAQGELLALRCLFGPRY
jgi:hypothetical protein